MTPKNFHVKTPTTVYIVVRADGRVREVFDTMPKWDWRADGERVFVANVNGGDAMEVK